MRRLVFHSVAGGPPAQCLRQLSLLSSLSEGSRRSRPVGPPDSVYKPQRLTQNSIQSYVKSVSEAARKAVSTLELMKNTYEWAPSEFTPEQKKQILWMRYWLDKYTKNPLSERSMQSERGIKALEQLQLTSDNRNVFLHVTFVLYLLALLLIQTQI
jgi:hypothetical protein